MPRRSIAHSVRSQEAPAVALGARLACEHHLLGPCAPLPALFEEILRDQRGLPVRSARFRRAQTILSEIRCQPESIALLAGMVRDAGAPRETQLLAACMLAMAHPEEPGILFPAQLPIDGEDLPWLPAMIARFPYPDTTQQYAAVLKRLLDGEARNADHPPAPLTLLAFLKGLCDGTLSQTSFSSCVLQAHVLHPGVTPHRPLRNLHPLLDYLGLAEDQQILGDYRQLAAHIWPLASPQNWAIWRWITRPGGPELFPQALRAFTDGDRSIMRLHELKYAELPAPQQVSSLLEAADPAIELLLCWLRADIRNDASRWPEAVRWQLIGNEQAAQQLCANPPWWPDWLAHGMPAMQRMLNWLQTLAVPHSGELPTLWHDWLEQHYIPGFRGIIANLLLAQAALGVRTEGLLALAEDRYLPALRALAFVPTPDERMLGVLRRSAHAGTRPERRVAHHALDYLAKRQGLPGADELERQLLLSTAWEPGPLGVDAVQVGWQHNAYRLRLALHAGKVRLDVLGPRGPLSHTPAVLRASDAYRQARAAQRETQAQYRLFRDHLERQMLENSPLSGGQFRYLLANPVFAHVAERLLWQTDDDCFLRTTPDRWETLQGTPVDMNDLLTVSVTHPVALSTAGTLTGWQRLAADRRLTQPFKQLFREIYTVEGESGRQCARFAGRKIDPRRAYAVLRAAGYAPGNGVARREWLRGITAHLCWAEGAAGRDLFGPHQQREVTTGDIWFTREGEPLPLDQVDPIVVSETLRAADLLTTRAAVGDAQLTSRETIALRAALLREMARSFSLTNLAVPEDGAYALVLGTRATYRVNLASGTVLLEPEGRQIIVPRPDVRWQPVEDGDATTEILALVIALAHDHEIADLTFLAQL